MTDEVESVSIFHRTVVYFKKLKRFFMKDRVILETHTMPEHVVIVIRTVPLYVPPPKMPSAYIYRPVYVEYPIQVIHPEDMV